MAKRPLYSGVKRLIYEMQVKSNWEYTNTSNPKSGEWQTEIAWSGDELMQFCSVSFGWDDVAAAFAFPPSQQSSLTKTSQVLMNYCEYHIIAFRSTGVLLYVLNIICKVHGFKGARGGAVGWGTALQVGRSQVQFPMVSLEFFIDIILPVVLWPWGQLSLSQKWVPGKYPGE